MATIAHYVAVNDTDYTTTGTTYDDLITVDAADIVGGGQYLVFWNLYQTRSHPAADMSTKLAWATTGDIAGSFRMREVGTTSGSYVTTCAMVLDAPATSEDLILKILNNSAGGGTGSTPISRLVMIRLDEDLTEDTDYYISVADDIASPVLVGGSGTYVDHNVMTETFAAGRWLVIGSADYNLLNSSASAYVRLESTGGGLTDGFSPRQVEEGEAATDHQPMWLPRVFDLDGTEATFMISGSGSSGTAFQKHVYSQLIAINLDKFDQSYFDYTVAEQTLTTALTWYETATTGAFTPTTAGDWFIMGSYLQDVVNGGWNRLQVDNVSVPSATAEELNTTRAVYYDARDQPHNAKIAIESLSGETTIDMDGRGNSASAKHQDSLLVAFSMELAGGGGTAIAKPLGHQRTDNQVSPIAASRINGVLQ